MARCFVIQPFDGGEFDARFTDVIKPAVIEAGLEAYRVDHDPSVSIPIQEIEAGIRDAVVCLADISIDNPNVWFELGYAIAAQKEVALICSDVRTTKFPFDVQHRSIIKYKTRSPRDFSELSNSITERIVAIQKKEQAIGRVTELGKLKPIEGLEQAEVVTLATVCENMWHTNDVAATGQIRRDMERAGFTGVATTISLKTLELKKLVETETFQDSDGDYISGYKLTDDGWTWVIGNKHQFRLTKTEPPSDFSPKKIGRGYATDLDDDIPF